MDLFPPNCMGWIRVFHMDLTIILSETPFFTRKIISRFLKIQYDFSYLFPQIILGGIILSILQPFSGQKLLLIEYGFLLK